MTDAEKVVKALRGRAQAAEGVGDCVPCDNDNVRTWSAFADFVEAATSTREHLGLGGGFTTQCAAKEQDAALARLAEVLR